MIREVLQSIEGIEIYPIISLIIFFSIFIGIVVWVVKMDKNKADRYNKIPLDEDNNDFNK